MLKVESVKLIVLSGQVAVDGIGRVVGATIEEQAARAAVVRVNGIVGLNRFMGRVRGPSRYDASPLDSHT